MNHGSAPAPGSSVGPTEKADVKLEKEAFVPLPNLTEFEVREFELVLELAGFTADIKKMIIKSPDGAAAKAMLVAALSVLGPAVQG